MRYPLKRSIDTDKQKESCRPHHGRIAMDRLRARNSPVNSRNYLTKHQIMGHDFMRSHVTYRISYVILDDDVKFAELVGLLEKNRAGFESLALFTSHTHSVVSLEIMRSRCSLLKHRIAELKTHGWEVGINLLCSTGFFKEYADAIPSTFVNYTDRNGNQHQGTFCPNQERYRREYLTPLLHLLTETDPDFIWLDDDNSKLACWCDHCIELFNRKHHTKYSREQLRDALDADCLEKRLTMRQVQIDFASETNRDLYSFVEKTVHAINPEIGLGAMTWNDWIATDGLPEALAGQTDCKVLWRPGGGAWHEIPMDEFLFRKGPDLACECAWLSNRVNRLQAEIENFNYQPLQKSIHSTVLESCIYTAAGCRGAAYNIFDGLEPLAVYAGLMEGLTNIRPFLEKIAMANGDQKPVGIYTGWTPRRNAVRGLEKHSWFDPSIWQETNAFDLWAPETPNRNSPLFCAGMPPAYRLAEAQVTMLFGEIAWALTDDELKQILSGGLYCDVKALQILHQRNFGELTGFCAAREFTSDVCERLLDHPLNGAGAGSIRDGRQAFSPGNSGWQLESLDGNAEKLAELIDYQGQVVADCSLGYYENKLGGRIAVAGYFATRNLLFFSKIRQLKNLFRHLSHNTLTTYVESFHRIGLWVRHNNGKIVVSLVNSSMDPAENVNLMIRTSDCHAQLNGMYGDNYELTGIQNEKGYIKFTLPTLQPWQLYLLNT